MLHSPQFISASKGSKKSYDTVTSTCEKNNGTNISEAVILLLKSVDKSFLPYAGKLFKQR